MSSEDLTKIDDQRGNCSNSCHQLDDNSKGLSHEDELYSSSPFSPYLNKSSFKVNCSQEEEEVDNSRKGKAEPTRVKLTAEEVESLSKTDLLDKWKRQEAYIDFVESQLNVESLAKTDLISLRESEEKLKQQQLEATRRENILVMRLTTKEQEMQDYVNQIQELKQSQIPGSIQLEATLVDPAVGIMFEKMKKAVDIANAKVEEMQSELSAWKFTPDSNTGKRLMAKCRLLYHENEELGKIISSGRVAKLEGDLALQRTFSDEMKKSQNELDDFLLELDEDVEGMQNTIVYLQQQLKEAKEEMERLLKELSRQSCCRSENAVKVGEVSHPHAQSDHSHCVNDNVSTNSIVNNNERTTDCKSHTPGQNSFKNMFQQVSGGVLRTASLTNNGPHNTSTETKASCVEDKELRTRHSKSIDIKQSEAESMPPVSQNCFQPSFFT